MKPRPPITRTKVGSGVLEWIPSPWPLATLRGGASSRSAGSSGVLRGELVRGDLSDRDDSSEEEEEECEEVKLYIAVVNGGGWW